MRSEFKIPCGRGQGVLVASPQQEVSVTKCGRVWMGSIPEPTLVLAVHGPHESCYCYFKVYAGTRNLNLICSGKKKSLKINRRDSSATLQHWSWCISTKHEGATRAHPDKWKMKAKNFFRASRGLIYLNPRYTPLRRCLLPCPPYF